MASAASSALISSSTHALTPAVDKASMWIRGLLCIYYVVRPAMLSLLHNDKKDPGYEGFSRDKTDLYQEITNLMKALKPEDFKILKADQLEIALPKDGKKETDSSNFDPTMIKFFIRHGTTLTPPRNGWRNPNPPNHGDDRRSYACCLAIKERNKLSHPSTIEFTVTEFDKLWDRLVYIVNDLGCYAEYQPLMATLKTGPLEPYITTSVDMIKNKLNVLVQHCQSKVNQKDFDLLDTKMYHMMNVLHDHTNSIEQLDASLVELHNLVKDIEVLEHRMDMLEHNMIENDEIVERLSESTTKNVVNINRLEERIELVEDITNTRLKDIMESKANIADINRLEERIDLTENWKIELEDRINTLEENFSIKENKQRTESSSTDESLDFNIKKAYDLDEGDNKTHIIEQKHGNQHLIIASHNCNQMLHHYESNDVKFDQNIQFCTGSKSAVKATQEEWLHLTINYVETFYSLKKNKGIDESIIFPTNFIFETEQSKLALSLRDYLRSTPSGIGAVITDYDAEEHLQFIATDQDLCGLGIQNIGSFKDRILLLQPDYNVIMNLRLSDSTDTNEVQKQLKLGEADITLLNLINKNIISKESATMLNIVAASHISRSEVECELCYIMDKDILSDKSKINLFLSDIVSECCKDLTESDQQQYHQVFKRIFCSTVGFMATRELPFPVPSLCGNTAKKVKSIRLTQQQLRIILSEHLKKIVLGNFGTGKTLLALYQLLFIYQNALESTTIYYICWDTVSLVVHEVNHFVSKLLPKENVKCCVTDIAKLSKMLHIAESPSLSKLITALVKQDTDAKLHIIVDEYDAELLSITESETLNEIFTTNEMVKGSVVLILPHSLEKHRSYNNGEENVSHLKYQYDRTGMKVFKLNKIMRTTINIAEVIEAAQDQVSSVNNVVYHPSTPVRQNVQMPVKKNGFLARVFARLKPSSITPPSQSTKLPSTNETQLIEINSNETQETEFIPIIDFDTAGAMMKRLHTDSNANTSTNFLFASNHDVVGHNIHGSIPIVILFDKTPEDDNRIISSLAIVFKKILKRETPNRMIISEDEYEQYLFKNTLTILNNNFIVYNQSSGWKLRDSKSNVLDSLPSYNYTLITTSHGSRGTEADVIIACFAPNEDHLRYCLIESASRSTSNLYLICLEDFDITKEATNGATVGNSIKRLIASNRVNVLMVSCSYNGNDEVDWEVEESTVNINSSEKPINILKINQLSMTYKRYKEKASIKPVYIEPLGAADDYYMKVLSKFDLPKPVEILNIVPLDESSCRLTWIDNGNKYIVQRMDDNHSTEFWKEIASYCKTSTLVVENLVLWSKYKFRVSAVNEIGVGKHATMEYEHISPIYNGNYSFDDIKELMRDNNIVNLRLILKKDPVIVHMRGGYRNDNTLLMNAVEYGNIELVILLIKHNADIHAVNDDGWNVFHYCGWYGHVNILTYILSIDSSVINNVTYYNFTSCNYTPLYFASINGNVDCVRVLLTYEHIDVDVRGDGGKTAHNAACNDYNGVDKQERTNEIKRLIDEFKKKI